MELKLEPREPSGFSILHRKSIDVAKSSFKPQKQTASDKREDSYNHDSGYARPNSGVLDSFARSLNKDVMQ
jgi:hypothetical protein